MAIGYQPSVDGINSGAGTLAIRWQKIGSDLLAFNTAAGGLNAAALQALGFTAGDATAMVAIIASMGTFAGVYHGTVAPAVFNYDTAFLPVRGTA